MYQKEAENVVEELDQFTLDCMQLDRIKDDLRDLHLGAWASVYAGETWLSETWGGLAQKWGNRMPHVAVARLDPEVHLLTV